MVATAEVLSHLSAAGISLALDGDRLLAKPATALTDHHRDLIRANKVGLIALLTTPRPTWDETEPDGATWRSCYAPPQTWAEVLSRYAPGTVAVPVEDPDPGAGLPDDVERLVLTWLDAIGEDDPQTRREVLAKAQADPHARADYLTRARLATPQLENHEGPDPSATDPQEGKP